MGLNLVALWTCSSVLDNPHLCQLADEETPISTSNNLGTTNQALEDEEAEDYNDISSEKFPFHCSLSLMSGFSASC